MDFRDKAKQAAREQGLTSDTEIAYFAQGCFWGAEKLYAETPGVIATTVGYQGGQIDNPSYSQVCQGNTGHAETVKVVFDPSQISYRKLVEIFFENHDPTQGNRQGADVGSQYRSIIFTTSLEQELVARQLLKAYDNAFRKAGYPPVTTEIVQATIFYVAEEYHQHYGAKAEAKGMPWYCPIHATGVGLDTDPEANL